MTRLRHQLLVDRDVQGLVLRRVALYATACFVYFSVILFFSKWVALSEQTWREVWFGCLDEMVYWLPGFAILAPVIAYDVIRTTHKFSGPIFRLRREMIRLVEGHEVDTLSLREDDYWTDLSEIFNRMRDELIELRRKQSQSEVVESQGSGSRLIDSGGSGDDSPNAESVDLESSASESTQHDASPVGTA